MATAKQLSEMVETFLNLLISHATGGFVEIGEFKRLRTELLNEPRLQERLPRFVRTCHDPGQFWEFIKHQSPTYQGRRSFLWSELGPIVDELDKSDGAPSDDRVASALASFSSDAVHEVWRDALRRRIDDPDGAITSARTLLESVCKHILDASGAEYEDGVDLPKLYRLTVEGLALAPSQQTESIMRQITGGCTSVVEGIGAMRNKLGDAHGRGQSTVQPEQRHAELAVNISGALAVFLVETYEARKGVT